MNDASGLDHAASSFRAWYRLSSVVAANLLEHSVIVCSFLRNPLNNVPVFDHFAVLKLVDIDNRKSERARLAHGMIVDDHKIAIREDVLNLAVVVRELVLQKRNITLETLRPVGSVRTVLCVARSEVFRGRVKIL